MRKVVAFFYEVKSGRIMLCKQGKVANESFECFESL